MAGLGVRNFTTEVLTSANVNGYLMQQSLMTFASAATRTAQFSAAGLTPTAGMTSFRTDEMLFEYYDGSAWKIYAGKVPHFRAQFTNTANTGLANTFTTQRNVGFTIVSSTRITPTYSGVYMATMGAINDTDSLRRDIQIRKNGTTIAQALNDLASGYHFKQLAIAVEMNVGDYLELYADEYYSEAAPNDWKFCSVVWTGSV